jgi:hypothetical protein
MLAAAAAAAMSLSRTAAASLAAAVLLLPPVCRKCMAHLMRPDRGRGPYGCASVCMQQKRAYVSSTTSAATQAVAC